MRAMTHTKRFVHFLLILSLFAVFVSPWSQASAQTSLSTGENGEEEEYVTLLVDAKAVHRGLFRQRSLDGASAKELDASLNKIGIEAEEVTPVDGLVFQGYSLRVPLSEVDEVKARYGEENVTEDFMVYPALDDISPHVGASAVWEMVDQLGQNITGKGVKVAIIDTGVDYKHPALGGCFGEGCKVVGGWDFYNEDHDPMDDNGHGTMVAGAIASSDPVYRGVAPDVEILAYKVFPASGGTSASYVISAIKRAVEDGADIINLSLGSDLGHPDDPLCQEVDAAFRQGVLVAVAGGNSGRLTTPGVAREALTVMQTDLQDWPYAGQSRGPVHGYYDLYKPNISAPASDGMVTTHLNGKWTDGKDGNPDSNAARGTSLATPLVAGSAALIYQMRPEWKRTHPDYARSVLINTAADLKKNFAGHTSFSLQQGAGAVRVDKAIVSPLVAEPHSIAFGVIADHKPSRDILLRNVSDRNLTVTATVTLKRTMEDYTHPLWPSEDVENPSEFISLNVQNFSLAPDSTFTLNLAVDIPADIKEGFYDGYVVLNMVDTDNGQEFTSRVPFSFLSASILRMNITYLEGQQDDPDDLKMLAGYYHREGDSGIVPIPGLNSGITEVEMFLGPGKYHFLFTINPDGYYFHLGDLFRPRSVFIVKEVVVEPHSTVVVDFDANETHPVTIDATSKDGKPVLLGEQFVSFVYNDPVLGREVFLVDTNAARMDFEKSTHEAFYPLNKLPASYTYYVSSMPENVRFTFSGIGYGFSPRYRLFVELNTYGWLEKNASMAGMDIQAWADELYLFSELITDETSIIRAYDPQNVRIFHVEYGINNLLGGKPIWETTGFSGREAILIPFTLNSSTASEKPTYLPVGINRTLYARTPFSLTYAPEKYPNLSDIVYSMQDIAYDESNWYYSTDYNFPNKGVYVDGNSLNWRVNAEMPPQDYRFGSAPSVASFKMDNRDNQVLIETPYSITSNQGKESPQKSRDHITATLNGDDIVTTQGINHQNYYRVISDVSGKQEARAAFNYTDIRMTSTYMETVATFDLSMPDKNPPYLSAIDMPVRLTPGKPIEVRIIPKDDSGELAAVKFEYQLDQGGWQNLPLNQSGEVYSGIVNPQSAQSMDIRITLADRQGNQAVMTTLNAAVREVPVIFELTSDKTSVPWNSQVNTIQLTGRLVDKDGKPFSTKYAVPIKVFADDQFYGYMRNVTFHPNSNSITYGDIKMNLKFVPTELFSEKGQHVLKFVFDLGIYEAKTIEIPLMVGGADTPVPTQPAPTPTPRPTEPAPNPTDTVPPTPVPTDVPSTGEGGKIFLPLLVSRASGGQSVYAVQSSSQKDVNASGSSEDSSKESISILGVFADGFLSGGAVEFVEIQNQSEFPVDLEDWKIRDESGLEFTFPSFTMMPEMVCKVFSGENRSDNCGFSFESDIEDVWDNGGDCAYIFNPLGEEVDSFCY